MGAKKKLPEAFERAVVYCRVSDPKQAEKDLSIPAQKRALRTWAAENGYQIVDEFIEPGESARDENRPEFRRMMGELLSEKVKAKVILLTHTSRFMRNAEASFVYRRKLQAKGIKVISTTQPIEDNPAGKLMETIFAAFDQYESDLNAYRTMAAMRENAECGYFNGSKAPFGFKVEKKKVGKNDRGKLVPNDEETPIGRVVFTLCIEGKGEKATAHELNLRGVQYRGHSWSKDDVKRVLDEHAAAGTYYWGKFDTAEKKRRDLSACVPIPVTPFVERDLFDLAQELRRSRSPARSPGRTPSSPLLLAGLLRCAKCGSSYSKETSGKAFAGEYPHAYYNCSSFLRLRKTSCKGKRVRVNVLDRVVLDHLADKLFTVERCRTLAQALVDQAGLLRRKADDRRVQLRAQVDHAEKGIARWESAFEAGRDLDVVAPRLRELREQRDGLAKTLRDLAPLAPAPKDLLTDATLKKFQDTIRDIFVSKDTPMTKNYLRFLIERIDVFEDRIEVQAKAKNAVALMAHGPLAKTGAVNHPEAVLAKGGEWLQLQDSNLRPGG
jgi:site-specific DNA recombinase